MTNQEVALKVLREQVKLVQAALRELAAEGRYEFGCDELHDRIGCLERAQAILLGEDD